MRNFLLKVTESSLASTAYGATMHNSTSVRKPFMWWIVPIWIIVNYLIKYHRCVNLDAIIDIHRQHLENVTTNVVMPSKVHQYSYSFPPPIVFSDNSDETDSDTINPYSNRTNVSLHSSKKSSAEYKASSTEPDSIEHTFNSNFSNKSKKDEIKPDVKVTIYHHQAIHDPLKKYGNGKLWNYYGNGYGLQYGYNLDGKYAREKGLKELTSFLIDLFLTLN